ncbi:hypothetical protein KP509_18G078800 [Ceratopteris richardii]|nr:hypothetical protein KP509_18G078800 [Ceratopteris richardii]
MGPSGSGKTTLLNVLAGQLSASSRLKLTGHLYVNGKPFVSSTHKVAYVRQEDLFFSQLTVRETLSLASELQLSNSLTHDERMQYVDDILYRLGLVSCADTRVGDAKVRGISGGEKKRLSIACELIASPSVIFADEPTTGLDAFQAERVMETLQNLAVDGHTVICSIHQPRGSIYAKFDDLILLAEGSLVYAGPAGDQALTYFTELGHPCPQHVNPAEFFADIISVDYSSPDNEAKTRARLESLVEAFNKKRSTESDKVHESASKSTQGSTRKAVLAGRKRIGWWKQFRLLLRRAWLQATRDGPTNKVRANMSISSAIIFGSIFWRMGFLQTAIQDRMGLLQVAAINTAMAALTKTVNIFPKERQVVDRERAKDSYALGPYLFSKLIAEIPVSASFPLMFGTILYPMAGLNPVLNRFFQFCGIITVEAFAASAMGLTVGAIAPTTEAAMALGPSIMTVFIVFGGYYVNSENTPAVFQWIPRVSLIRWAFQALCLNEFRGLKFEHQHTYDIETGEQALERMSFGKSSIKEALLEECRILLFWYCLSYTLLKRNTPRFQKLDAPCPNTSVKIEEMNE